MILESQDPAAMRQLRSRPIDQPRFPFWLWPLRSCTRPSFYCASSDNSECSRCIYVVWWNGTPQSRAVWSEAIVSNLNSGKLGCKRNCLCLTGSVAAVRFVSSIHFMCVAYLFLYFKNRFSEWQADFTVSSVFQRNHGDISFKNLWDSEWVVEHCICHYRPPKRILKLRKPFHGGAVDICAHSLSVNQRDSHRCVDRLNGWIITISL